MSPGLPRVEHAAATSKPPPRLAPSNVLTGAAKPFQLGLPAVDAFPRKLWSRLIAWQGRGLSVADMGYPEHAGFAPLREAIAAYLAVSRGILCEARQIVITSATKVHSTRSVVSCSVAETRSGLKIPDTTWHAQRWSARAYPWCRSGSTQMDCASVTVSPVRTMRGSLLSHHRIRRRLVWRSRCLGGLPFWPGRAKRAYVVEDDYDGEFRYRGRPLPALKASTARTAFFMRAVSAKFCSRGCGLAIWSCPRNLLRRSTI